MHASHVQKVLSHMDSAVQGNDFELIATVRMESQHTIGAPTCHDFPRFVIISEKSRLEVGNRSRWSWFFGKKRSLTEKFLKVFPERIRRLADLRLVCKFCEIWPTGSRWNRALLTRQKKQKLGTRSPRFCADRAQNLSGQLQTIYSEFPKFYPNPFTSGWVIAGRVNIVEKRHKVFPILGEASSPSKYRYIDVGLTDQDHGRRHVGGRLGNRPPWKKSGWAQGWAMPTLEIPTVDWKLSGNSLSIKV